MRVNRIYFRGLKTFQCGFVIFLIWTGLPGCVNLGKIIVRSDVVVESPMIVDIEVIGACEQAQVFIEQGEDEHARIIARATKNTLKQAGSAVCQSRIKLESIASIASGSPHSIRVLVQCPDHGEQTISHTIVDEIDQNHSTPDWAKGLVWYQVFPERFCDGNPNNTPNGWDLTPIAWNSAFEEVGIEEVERAWNRNRVDPRHYPYRNNRSGGSITTVAFARRYGGDLIGVYNQLESLRDQGYTGVYLCPIFQSRSLHKYDADDHRHIDPTLGHPGVYNDPGPGHTRLGMDEDTAVESTWAWTISDRWFVDEFLPKAKSLGLRVVLDGVWNHVGTDHFAFSDIVEHGDASAFVDWFDVEFDDEGQLLAWKSWGSVNGNLPVFTQTEVGDLAPGPKAHIMAVTRRWMDPNGDGDPSDGIDGWRLDVAGEIGQAFWKDWRAHVRLLNPDAVVIAEIWSDADKVLHSDGFDGQMNYPFAYAVADWLSIGDTKGDAAVCAERLNAVFDHDPEHDLVQFNLMTSHDTERLASMMHNDFARGYDQGASRWAQGTQYDAVTVLPNDRDRALAAIATMIAAPGSMMMYNGDEYAMAGADDPDNRRPIPWDSIEGNEDGEGVRFNRAVNELLRLRNEPAIGELLRFGDIEFVGREDGSLVIRRQLNSRRVEFLIPNGAGAIAPVWSRPGDGWYEQSERSRKIGILGGSLGVQVRVMVEKIGDTE